MDTEFGRVIDALPGLVWTARPDGYADFLNQRWLDYTGLSIDGAMGEGWQTAVHADDRSGLLGAWADHVSRGQGGEFDARLRRHDGAYRWFNFRFSPIADPSGRIVKWCGINTDIEGLKRAEDSARTLERRFRSIIEGLPAIVTLMTPEGEFAYGNQHMIDYLGAPFEELKARPTTESFHPDDRPEVERRWKHSIDSGEPYDYEARLKGSDGVYRWFHSRGFPLRDPDGSIALWYLLQENINDRRRADDALRASEQNARAIVDGIPGLVAVFSPEGILEQVNPQVVAFWGKSLEELKDWTSAGVLHPGDAARTLSAFGKAVASKSPFELEVRARRFDGVHRWLQSRGFPVKDDDGRIVRWYNLLIDIDERKRVEEALAASERNLQLIIDTTPALIWSARPDGNTESVNQHFLDYLGQTFEQMKTWVWTDAIHPEDQDGLAAAWSTLQQTGEAGQFEARLRRHDGQYRWFLLRTSPLRDETGAIVKWYGVNTDIEDRKRAEEARSTIERDLRVMIDTIPAFAWSADHDGREVYYNRHYLDYLGLPLEALQSQGWTKQIHPDDLEENQRAWKAAEAAGVLAETESRIRRHDGVYRWFLFRVSPLKDEAGNIIKWYGVNTDIEDRKRAESALRTSERNLQLSIDATPAMVWTTDAVGRTVAVNQNYLDYVGLPPEQLLGWGWAAVIHPDDRQRLTVEWQAILASAAPGVAEARLRRHDGEYRWFLFRANPVRDEYGELVNWYGVNTDIEDRKRAEDAVAASERNLRQTVNTIPALVFCNHPDGPNEYLNQRWHDYTGLSPEQVGDGGWRTPIHPDDLPRMMDKWMAMFASGESGEVEGRLRRFDGVYRWFLFRTDALRDETGKIVKWYGTTTDIEDLKQTEQELRRSEAFLSQGESVSDTGSFLWRLATNDITWSHQLYRIFGFELGSLITLDRIATRVHPEDLPTMDAMVARARAGRDSEYEHRLLLPDGTVKYMHFVARAMRDREGGIEYIGVVQDVTERRLAEQALSKVRSELAHVSRVSSLGALTASIAHEVNQPLAGIVTNASTCLRMLGADPPNVEGARETARRTIRDGNRAAEVITRLRALFGKKETSVELVDLNEAAREVVALSMNELQRSRVVLRQDFADDLPSISGDRVQLQQVVLNLILNATDAMSDVGDRLRLLTIKTELDEDEQVRLSVQDSGVGIDPQSATKMFDAFYTTKPGGMGIGLSVSRSIIDRHQGRLWARSNDGPGATFAFSIPRGELRVEPAAFRSTKTDAQGTSPH